MLILMVVLFFFGFLSNDPKKKRWYWLELKYDRARFYGTSSKLITLISILQTIYWNTKIWKASEFFSLIKWMTLINVIRAMGACNNLEKFFPFSFVWSVKMLICLVSRHTKCRCSIQMKISLKKPNNANAMGWTGVCQMKINILNSKRGETRAREVGNL